MKQEKKQTLWVDIEAKLQPWQEQALSRLSRGLKKGEPYIIGGTGRRTGKSQMAAMYMESVFGSPWEEWQDVFVWPWNAKTSIESKKRIWGRIKVRYNKVVYENTSRGSRRQRQYATKKEVFQRKLKGKW